MGWSEVSSAARWSARVGGTVTGGAVGGGTTGGGVGRRGRWCVGAIGVLETIVRRGAAEHVDRVTDVHQRVEVLRDVHRDAGATVRRG